MINKVEIIKLVMCNYFNITEKELEELFKDKEKMYLMLLLMKKYNCFDKDIIEREIKKIISGRVKRKVDKAEEKVLVNKEFRNIYFNLEEEIDRIIGK